MRDFSLPDPHEQLNVIQPGESISRDEQLVRIELAYTKLLSEKPKPAAVVVVGDVNSTLAAARTAKEVFLVLLSQSLFENFLIAVNILRSYLIGKRFP